MNIGEFKQSNGRMMGSIATRTIDLPRLGLRAVESRNDRAPAFEILALNVGNRWVQVGALWQAVAKHTTGEIFFQGTIDDPSLAEPLPIALFGTEEDGYRVAWRRPQRRDDFGSPARGSLAGQPGGAGAGAGDGQGGFGESTASGNGELMLADADADLVDDDVPY